MQKKKKKKEKKRRKKDEWQILTKFTRNIFTATHMHDKNILYTAVYIMYKLSTMELILSSDATHDAVKWLEITGSCIVDIF